jgi:hypothetical protein
VHHSWVAKVGSDVAIDVTWREPGTRYVGVPFEPATVAKLAAGASRWGGALVLLTTDLTPHMAPDHHDPQRDTVYRAEEQAIGESYALGDDPIPVDDLATFVATVVAGAGWEVAHLPTFVVDVPDEGDYSAWHEGGTGTIHLHPKLIWPWTVLHEVAHWLRPRDGIRPTYHGPTFSGVLVGLWHAAFGWHDASTLRETFRDFGVDVDDSWHELDEDE